MATDGSSSTPNPTGSIQNLIPIIVLDVLVVHVVHPLDYIAKKG